MASSFANPPACIQSVTRHADGAGWRSILEALAIAANDRTDTVVDQALDAVQPVIEGLFRPGGAIPSDLFPACLSVLSQAMRNPHHEKLSISAVYLAQTAGHCLAASNPSVSLADDYSN